MGQVIENPITLEQVQYIDLICFLNSAEEMGEQLWLVDKDNSNEETNAIMVNWDGFYKGIGMNIDELEENLVSAIYEDDFEERMDIVIKSDVGTRNYLLEQM